MLYDVRMRMKFKNKKDSDELWAILKKTLKGKDIRTLEREKSFIHYHECYHDESPVKACVDIERIER